MTAVSQREARRPPSRRLRCHLNTRCLESKAPNARRQYCRCCPLREADLEGCQGLHRTSQAFLTSYVPPPVTLPPESRVSHVPPPVTFCDRPETLKVPEPVRVIFDPSFALAEA